MAHIPHFANLKQFKSQAKELLKDFQNQQEQAVLLFQKFHPNLASPEQAKLTDAQSVLAHKYGFSNWQKACEAINALVSFRGLLQAFDKNDLTQARNIIRKSPNLLNRKDILGRAVRHGTLKMVELMYELGATNVQHALGYIVYQLKPDIAEYLLQKGASFSSFDVLPGSEVLNSKVMDFSLNHFTGKLDQSLGKRSIAMLLSTYSRNPTEKHACLEIIEHAGIHLPDTPTMALHRGRIDLLEKHLSQNAGVLNAHFREGEIYPAEFDIKSGDGLHLTPLDGATLLHMAVEYDEREMMKFLVQKGADINARSAIDNEGFGGHTPIFHTVVSYTHHDDSKARFLLEKGANPNASAIIRKQLRYMGQQHLEKMYIFKEVTPIGFAKQFQVQDWVSHRSIQVLEEYGGEG